MRWRWKFLVRNFPLRDLSPCLYTNTTGVELIVSDIFDQVLHNDYILSRFKLKERAVQQIADQCPKPPT
jgi:hypothetical protein